MRGTSLAFARLFYSRPKFALLDEATSALSAGAQKHLYNQCREVGITVVSIGHSESLMRYHTQLLELRGDGSWKLSPLDSVR